MCREEWRRHGRTTCWMSWTSWPKGELEVNIVEKLFTKIRNDFGETPEEERKIEQLRTIE